MDRATRWLTALAGLCIIAILIILIGSYPITAGKTILAISDGGPFRGNDGGRHFPAIFGTSALVLLMSIFVAPAGVFVAIYFSEYADRSSWFYYISRQAVNNLAGVPSIVFGLFGLGFFVQFVGKGIERPSTAGSSPMGSLPLSGPL